MLDLAAVTSRANARTAATPANPANRLIGGEEAAAHGISQLATLAEVDAADALGQAADVAESVSQLATLAGGADGDAIDDDRVTCGRCLHFERSRWHCGNHRLALLATAVVGPALAALPQRCPGYRAGPS
jgi:hypothetical protein